MRQTCSMTESVDLCGPLEVMSEDMHVAFGSFAFTMATGEMSVARIRVPVNTQ